MQLFKALLPLVCFSALLAQTGEDSQVIAAKADLEKTGLSMLQFTPFARGLVTFDKEPAAVPEALIVAIRKKLEEINRKGGEVMAALVPGQAVLITDGPFAGYSGIFDVRLSGSDRVKVLIELLSKRYMPVELNVGQVEVLKKK